MIDALLKSPQFAAFLVASLLLAITPGPAVVFIVTRTIAEGRRAGLASVGGIALGNLGNATAASLGLAALLSMSATAFVLVKLAGAAYLVFLGIKALRGRPAADVAPPAARRAPGRMFRDGFFVALLNPKTALFFAALLPQFINPDGSPLGQSVVLSCVFVSVAMCTDSIYVLTASALASALSRRAGLRPYGQYVTGASLIGLGIYAALASPRSSN